MKALVWPVFLRQKLTICEETGRLKSGIRAPQSCLWCKHGRAVSRGTFWPAIMGLTYFKRFRMEIDLRGRDFANPALPVDFYFVPWSRAHLEAHAEAKFASFRDEIDSNVFPCLGEYSGCLHLMEEIAAKPGFLPDATWLIASKGSPDSIKTIEIHPQRSALIGT